MKHVWHGSISALKIPKSSSRPRRFIPPPRQIRPVPWTSVQQMEQILGREPGEWRLSTNQVGHVQGLPHIVGAKVAIWRGKCRIWRDGNDSMIVCNSNFVGHYMDRE